MSQGLPDAALLSLQQLINGALSLDARAAESLQPLDTRRFKIDCSAPPLVVCLTVASGEVHIHNDDGGRFDTTLRGGWADFLAVATADDPGSKLINSDIQVGGDSSHLLELRKVLAGLDLDWEAPIANVIGDVAAHQIGKAVRNGGRLLSGLFGAARQRLHRYVMEDGGLVPTPEEVEDFYDQISELAERSERCEARSQRLQRRLDALTGQD